MWTCGRRHGELHPREFEAKSHGGSCRSRPLGQSGRQLRPDDRETVKRLGSGRLTKSEANSVPASTAVPCRSKSRSHPAMAGLIPNRSTVPLTVDAEASIRAVWSHQLPADTAFFPSASARWAADFTVSEARREICIILVPAFTQDCRISTAKRLCTTAIS